MTVEKWLLPEGVEEALPNEARSIEQLRRRLLDLYHRWGYEHIMPPLIEFTDSLLSGVGRDLNLLTLKVTDQLSGRMMGLRADITPQAARIDAHSYVRQGVNRFCYADYVLRTKPKSPLKTRTPLQAGVELFGEAGLDADIEVISLLLASLIDVEVPQLTLDLGHVGVFRAIAEAAELNQEQEVELLELLQTKDALDIERWIGTHIHNTETAAWLNRLHGLRGAVEMLDLAQDVLNGAPDEVFAAIDELRAVHKVIHDRYPQVQCYFDLGELRGYHYHTGIVFAAYGAGFGDALANGGRYDHIGETFGRARPATGFGINVSALMPLLSPSQAPAAIFAPSSEDPAQWQAIQALRAEGHRVVCGLSDDSDKLNEIHCDRELVLEGGKYTVKTV